MLELWLTYTPVWRNIGHDQLERDPRINLPWLVWDAWKSWKSCIKSSLCLQVQSVIVQFHSNIVEYWLFGLVGWSTTNPKCQWSKKPKAPVFDELEIRLNNQLTTIKSNTLQQSTILNTALLFYDMISLRLQGTATVYFVGKFPNITLTQVNSVRWCMV